MKKYILTITALLLTILTGCGAKAEPINSMVSPTSSAQVSGQDVFFEHNGKYYVAKGQQKNFQNVKTGDMLVIQMSDGSFIIQNNAKGNDPNGYDPKANQAKSDAENQKLEQERQAELNKQQMLEDDQTAYMRKKELSKQDLDQQKLDLQADAQKTNFQNATNLLKAQIAKIQAETKQTLSQLK